MCELERERLSPNLPLPTRDEKRRERLDFPVERRYAAKLAPQAAPVALPAAAPLEKPPKKKKGEEKAREKDEEGKTGKPPGKPAKPSKPASKQGMWSKKLKGLVSKMVGSGHGLIALRLVRSKLRKREETNNNSLGHGTVHGTHPTRTHPAHPLPQLQTSDSAKVAFAQR